MKKRFPNSLSILRQVNPLTGMRTLLRFLRPYRWHAAALVILGVSASLFEATGISLMCYYALWRLQDSDARAAVSGLYGSHPEQHQV